MKVAYVTTYDASDVRAWSGSGSYVARALEKAGAELTFIGPLRLPTHLKAYAKAKGGYYNRLRRQRYFRDHDTRLAQAYAQRADALLAQHPDLDLIFSPGVIPVAYLKDPRPLVFWSDATHAAIFDYYDEYSNLSDNTRRHGHEIERQALGRAAAALFTSFWAADSAKNDYLADPARVHVLEFGANLDEPPTEAEVHAALAARPHDKFRILFVGVDWIRKGGPLATFVTDLLRKRGIDAELTVVGCEPFDGPPDLPGVRVEGFVSKKTPEGRARLRELFLAHHVLFVPSHAECYGLVYCEANAHGLPAFARYTGGVPQIIAQGVNGRLLDPHAPPEAWADLLASLHHDRPAYEQMCLAAYKEFRHRLNWDTVSEKLRPILQKAAHSSQTPARV